MAAEGSNDTGRRQRTSKGRRNWNNEEEEILLACLKELVATGWKLDNGFRAGYINKLEEAMRIHYPRANIKATPHITSKLTGWKKNYGSLSTILSRSGVGFNLHGDFTVDCDNETWEHICNVDSNAINIRGKSWPFYNRWVEVFGKDRATGDSAEDVMEAVHELIVEDNQNGPDDFHVDKSVDIEDEVEATETDNSVCNSTRRDNGPARILKRRKVNDNNDRELCELLGQMQRDTNDRLDTISHRIGHQADLRKERKEIFALLEGIPDLSLNERLDVCCILVDNPSRMELFTSLPEVARLTFVQRLMIGKDI